MRLIHSHATSLQNNLEGSKKIIRYFDKVILLQLSIEFIYECSTSGDTRVMVGIRAYQKVWNLNASVFANLRILMPNATSQSFDSIPQGTMEYYNGLGKKLFFMHTSVELVDVN